MNMLQEYKELYYKEIEFKDIKLEKIDSIENISNKMKDLSIDKFIWKDDKKTRDMISQLINDKKLFPVLGSGFTAKCKAKNGVVPSGKDMITYMIEFLSKAYDKPAESFQGRNFPDLCTLYSKKSTIDEKFDYFSSNFTEVIIEEEKKRFLSLFTQYVYTLNIDDGIEHNCSQFNVLLPNTEIFDKYIEKYTTVFKLHGDVSFYLKNIENENNKFITDVMFVIDLFVCGNKFYSFLCIDIEISRKRIIRTRLKRRNFGIFRIVVFARHKALLHLPHQNLLKISSVWSRRIFRERIFGCARQKRRKYFVYFRVF